LLIASGKVEGHPVRNSAGTSTENLGKIADLDTCPALDSVLRGVTLMQHQRQGIDVNRYSVVCAVLLLAVGSGAAAQDARKAIEAMLQKTSGTLFVRNVPHIVEGKLKACQLTYEALSQDWTYRQGQYLKISGSVGFIIAGKPRPTLANIVKVIVQEVSVGADGQLAFLPSPPDRAFLLGADFNSNLDTLANSAPSDTPGGVIAFYQASPALEMVMDGLDRDRLTVPFNRSGGATDMQLVVETDVVDVDAEGKKTRSEQPKADFLNCPQTLLASLKLETK
jgi:hypothetical protein